MKKKIPVGILGATGIIGQRFVELLHNHPWFEINSLAASERSIGKKYGEATKWMMPSPLSSHIANLQIQACAPILPCRIVFSGLESLVAGPIEERFAEEGYLVISNASSHRMHPLVPLLIPEVNESHLELIQSQLYPQGGIVTNPNCSVVGLVMALKPLIDCWGIDQAHVVTLQAISGAGYPGIPSFDIWDNVIPFIAGEEEKVQSEPLKILGTIQNGKIEPYQMTISAQCNRVPIMDGHMASISVKLKNPATKEEIIESWKKFIGAPQLLRLPSSPQNPLFYSHDERHPQPKLHRDNDKGMTVTIGQLRKCPLLDWKFSILSHNTIRGGAGCALLNAELIVAKKHLGRVVN